MARPARGNVSGFARSDWPRISSPDRGRLPIIEVELEALCFSRALADPVSTGDDAIVSTIALAARGNLGLLAPGGQTRRVDPSGAIISTVRRDDRSCRRATLSPRLSMAETMRASLLATAATTTLKGRRPHRPIDPCPGWCSRPPNPDQRPGAAHQPSPQIAVAVLPRRRRAAAPAAVRAAAGRRPSQAAKLRRCRAALPHSTPVATMAVAMTGPIRDLRQSFGWPRRRGPGAACSSELG